MKAVIYTRVSTEEQAKDFFVGFAAENSKLVEKCLPYIAKSSTVFDVGANAGYFSEEILKTGFKGQLVLFEPIPNLLSIAINTLAEYENPKIFVNAALGEAQGNLELFLPNNSNIGWITAVREKTKNAKSIIVTVSSTLYFVEKYRPFSMV